MFMMVSFCTAFFPRDVLDEILNLIKSVSEVFPTCSSLGQAYRCLIVWFILLPIFSAAMAVSRHVCFILVYFLFLCF